MSVENIPVIGKLLSLREEWEKTNNQIARQVAMLDRSKLVSLQCFLDCLDKNAMFSSHLVRYFPSFIQNYAEAALKGTADILKPVPFPVLQPEDQEILRNRHADLQKHPNKAPSSIYLPDRTRQIMMEVCGKDTDLFQNCLRPVPANGDFLQSYTPMSTLGDILNAWPALNPGEWDFRIYKTVSFLIGRKQAFVDFLKAANDLKDYSGLFPPRTGNGENAKPKRRERAVSPVFIPVPVTGIGR